MRPLYVDNHVLALDKPCGLLTQPSGQTADSLERQGKELIRQMFAKPGNVFLEAVHRVDRPACGVVLFARTSKALSRLNAAMRGHGCVKRYRAILAATPRDHDGELTDWLVHDDFRARAASPGEPGARECRLAYRVLRTLPGGRALVDIGLETGRYHQIRAQFALRGCPLLGDTRYGGPPAGPPGAIALQHHSLTTPHPTRPEPLTITSDIDLTHLFPLN